MIEAILFDMDGVLVDSEPFHAEIEKRQFVLNQISISSEEHSQFTGIASEVMWKQLASQLDLDLSAEELTEQNRIESIRFFNDLSEIPVTPGLTEILDKLTEKQIPLAVASSSFPEIIDLVLTRTRLKKYFQVIVSSQEAGKSKPEPDVFLLAAKKLGVEPKKCIVIEDSANGIKAAKSAGMFCIAYQGTGADPLKQTMADKQIVHYSELMDLLF
jgi:beta-phosphoglucomutase family hydrolase